MSAMGNRSCDAPSSMSSYGFTHPHACASTFSVRSMNAETPASLSARSFVSEGAWSGSLGYSPARSLPGSTQ